MANDDLRPRGRGFESIYTDVSDKAIGITLKIKNKKGPNGPNGHLQKNSLVWVDSIQHLFWFQFNICFVFNSIFVFNFQLCFQFTVLFAIQHFFRFSFQDDFEDKDRRQRQWFTVAEAERILVPHKPNHLRYLAAFTATKSTVGDGKRCQVLTQIKVIIQLCLSR